MEKEQYEIMRRIEDSHWWYVGMREIVRGLLPAPSSGADRTRILDAGCGTGATLDFLAGRGTVVGVDVAGEALGHCCRRGQRNISYGTVERLPFRSGCFDLVTCFDVIYHRAVGDDLAALHEFHRVLRPEGTLVLRVPAYDWLRGAHDDAVHTRHRYGGREMREKLSLAGFRPIKITHANTLLFPLAVVKRLLEGRGVVFGADLNQPRPLVNGLLLKLLSLEAWTLRLADLPWGLSVIGVGVKQCVERAVVGGSRQSS